MNSHFQKRNCASRFLPRRRRDEVAALSNHTEMRRVWSAPQTGGAYLVDHVQL